MKPDVLLVFQQRIESGGIDLLQSLENIKKQNKLEKKSKTIGPLGPSAPKGPTTAGVQALDSKTEVYSKLSEVERRSIQIICGEGKTYEQN